jgi:hypothetical protein
VPARVCVQGTTSANVHFEALFCFILSYYISYNYFSLPYPGRMMLEKIYRSQKCQIGRPLSRIEGRNCLRRPKLCIKSCRATIKIRIFFLTPRLLGRYSDWLRDGRSGGRIPMWVRFSAPVLTGPRAHPASYTMGKVARAWPHPPTPSRVEVVGLTLFYNKCSFQNVTVHLANPNGKLVCSAAHRLRAVALQLSERYAYVMCIEETDTCAGSRDSSVGIVITLRAC